MDLIAFLLDFIDETASFDDIPAIIHSKDSIPGLIKNPKTGYKKTFISKKHFFQEKEKRLIIVLTVLFFKFK